MQEAWLLILECKRNSIAFFEVICDTYGVAFHAATKFAKKKKKKSVKDPHR